MKQRLFIILCSFLLTFSTAFALDCTIYLYAPGKKAASFKFKPDSIENLKSDFAKCAYRTGILIKTDDGRRFFAMDHILIQHETILKYAKKFIDGSGPPISIGNSNIRWAGEMHGDPQQGIDEANTFAGMIKKRKIWDTAIIENLKTAIEESVALKMLFSKNRKLSSFQESSQHLHESLKSMTKFRHSLGSGISIFLFEFSEKRLKLSDDAYLKKFNQRKADWLAGSQKKFDTLKQQLELIHELNGPFPTLMKIRTLLVDIHNFEDIHQIKDELHKEAKLFLNNIHKEKELSTVTHFFRIIEI